MTLEDIEGFASYAGVGLSLTQARFGLSLSAALSYELDRNLDLVVSYTHRPPTHPGEMLLEEFIKPLGITQTELAMRLGITRVRLSEIIRERRGVTPDTALRLEKVLGMSADFWLSLQMKVDLWQAQQTSQGLEELELLVKG